MTHSDGMDVPAVLEKLDIALVLQRRLAGIAGTSEGFVRSAGWPG